MKIQRITITLLRVTGSHPVTSVHGAQHRNYYFFKGSHGEAFTRIYEAGEFTAEQAEARRDRGIFPLEMARADMRDLANGNLHPAGILVELATVEEVEAELAEAAAARKRAEEEERARNERLAELEAEAERAAGEAKALKDGGPLLTTESAEAPAVPDKSDETNSPDAGAAPAPTKPTRPQSDIENGARKSRRGANVKLPGA